MNNNNFFGNQSIIITLDVDSLLIERLQQIVQAGFSIVELNSCEPALLKKILHEFPTLKIGIGNVINVQQLQDYYHAGAHFISSPGFLSALVQTASVYSINYLSGIATISEAMQVMTLGCYQVRPYPSTLSFCAALNKYFPMLRLFPAEVEMEEVEHYLSLPSVNGVAVLNPEARHLKYNNIIPAEALT